MILKVRASPIRTQVGLRPRHSQFTRHHLLSHFRLPRQVRRTPRIILSGRHRLFDFGGTFRRRRQHTGPHHTRLRHLFGTHRHGTINLNFRHLNTARHTITMNVDLSRHRNLNTHHSFANSLMIIARNLGISRNANEARNNELLNNRKGGGQH